MLIDFQTLAAKYNLNIQGVIHIGAHYGEEWPTYKAMGIGHKILFEADPVNFAELERRGIPDHIWLENLAVGNTNGPMLINYETRNNGQSNSILKAKQAAVECPDIVYHGQRTVEMIRLDDFAKRPDRNLSPFNMIVIDIEGYELEAFKGAAKLLNQVDYILTEVSNVERYAGQALVEDLDTWLAQYGFERVETDWGGVSWGDALYIKTNPIFVNEQEEKDQEVKKARPRKKKADA